MMKKLRKHTSPISFMRIICLSLVTSFTHSFYINVCSSKNVQRNIITCTWKRVRLHSADNELPSSKHTLYMKTSSSDDNTNNKTSRDNMYQNDDWVAGDVTNDFEQLRQAVAKIKAEDDLKQKERIELLNEFARQRRLLYPDIKRYILRPISWTIFLVVFDLFTKRSSSNRVTAMNNILRYFWKTMNATFWTTSVIFPLLLYTLKILSTFKRNNKQVTLEEEDEFDSYEMEYQSARNDCHDYVLCILENWVSSIIVTSLLGAYYLDISSLLRKISNTLNREGLIQSIQSFTKTSLRQPLLICLLSQFINRLGAVASIHQYPKLLYDLRRKNQPRPIQYFPFQLNRLTNISLLILPFAFASDLSQIISVLMMKTHNCPPVGSMIPTASLINTHGVYGKLAFFFSIIPPSLHLLALLRIFKIQYFTDLSLSTEYSKGKEILNDIQLSNYKWRYKLRWREPRRLLLSIKSLWYDFLLFLFSGWGEGESSMKKKQLGMDSNVDEVEPKILSLLREEIENSPFDSREYDRSNWVSSATTTMAAIHQENYEDKNFYDPLGIAVQQTLGIGLSFDFDHETKLKEGEEPSIHRLRARAAKSAIKRINSIPMEIKNKVDHLENLDDRINLGIQLAEESKKEISYLANELLNSIPSNAPPPEGKDLNVEGLGMSDALALKLPTSRNLTASQVEKPDHWKEAIRRIYGEEYVDDPYLNAEEVFVQEFLKRKNMNKQKRKEGNEEDNILNSEDGYLA